MELERHAEWIERQARWMARRFRTEPAEAYQLLALAMCQGMNRKHARLRTIRTLLRDSGRVAQQGQQMDRAVEPEQMSEVEALAAEVLTEREWVLVTLHTISGLSLREVAHQLRIGRETARRLYHGALDKLREAF